MVRPGKALLLPNNLVIFYLSADFIKAFLAMSIPAAADALSPFFIGFSRRPSSALTAVDE